MLHNPHVLLTFGRVQRIPCACQAKRHLNLVRACNVFNILTWKCASRHNCAHFFDISTSPKIQKLPEACVSYILTWTCASCHNSVQFFIYHLPRRLRTRRFSEPTFRPSGATNQWNKNIVFRDFATFSRTCIFCLMTLSLLWSSLFFPSLLWLFPPLLSHLFILSEVWLPNFFRLIVNVGFSHYLMHWFLSRWQFLQLQSARRQGEVPKPAGTAIGHSLWRAMSLPTICSGHRYWIMMIGFCWWIKLITSNFKLHSLFAIWYLQFGQKHMGSGPPEIRLLQYAPLPCLDMLGSVCWRLLEGSTVAPTA